MTERIEDILNNLDDSTPVKLKPINIKGKSNTKRSFFAECFKDESKRKLIILVGNKRKKLIKTKYKKRFVKPKNYVPNLMKIMRKSKSKNMGIFLNNSNREKDVFIIDFTPSEKSQSIKIEPQNVQ